MKSNLRTVVSPVYKAEKNIRRMTARQSFYSILYEAVNLCCK